jgi:hypothetical protein
MDYDNPQFIAAVKKILRRFTEEAREEPPTGQDNADASVKPEGTPPIVGPVLNISDSVIDKIKAKTDQEKRREKIKDRVEIATVGIVLLYAIFEVYAWYELNTQNINLSAANISSGATADRNLLKFKNLLKKPRSLLALRINKLGLLPIKSQSFRLELMRLQNSRRKLPMPIQSPNKLWRLKPVLGSESKTILSGRKTNPFST